MGECGCSAFHGDCKFQGPNGLTYVVQIRESCFECCTPAGIVIYAFTEDDMDLWDCHELPDLQVYPEGTGIPVIYPATLKKLMKSAVGGDSYEAIVCEEGVDGCFEDAVRETIQEWADELNQASSTS